MMTETMPKCMNCWHSTIPRGLSPTKSRWYVWCAKHERNIKDFYSCDDYREDAPLSDDNELIPSDYYAEEFYK